MSRADDNRYRTALLAYALSIGLMVIASLFPETRVWGLAWYGYFDWSIRAIWLVTAVAIPFLVARLTNEQSLAGQPSGGSRYSLYAALIIVVLGAGFYFARTRTFFLGDGFLLLNRLADGTHPIRPWNPAVYWVQDQVNQLLGATGEPSARAAFRLISITSGLLFLLAAALTAARLYRQTLIRSLFLLGTAAGGYALVFFGYVENYPLFIMAVGIFSLLGILVSRGIIARWWPLIPFAAAAPLHPFAVGMIPALIFLLVSGTSLGSWVNSRSWWQKTAALLVLVVIGAYAFYHFYNASYFFRLSIVPLVDNRFTVEGYTLFSAKHLIDLINLLWQLLPGILAAGLIIYWNRRRWRERGSLFLLLLLAGTAGIAFLFDPKLGMPRDWDIFCFVGIPLTLLMLLFGLDRDPRSAASVRAVALAIALGFMLLVPRVATQAIPKVSIEVFDNFAELDIFKNTTGRFLLLKYLEREGRQAEADRRRTANARIAQFEFTDRRAQQLMRQGDIRGAKELYHRMLDDFAAYHNAWTNLGICHYQLREYDSAVTCLRVSDGLNPYSVVVYHYLALALYASGHDEEAEERWLDAMELVPGDYRPYTYLLLMYEYSGRTDDYNRLADSVLRLATNPESHAEFSVKAAEIYLKRGDTVAAERAAREALQKGAAPAKICDLQQRYEGLQVIACDS